jgi:hypothetical protein
MSDSITVYLEWADSTPDPSVIGYQLKMEENEEILILSTVKSLRYIQIVPSTKAKFWVRPVNYNRDAPYSDPVNFEG